MTAPKVAEAAGAAIKAATTGKTPPGGTGKIVKEGGIALLETVIGRFFASGMGDKVIGFLNKVPFAPELIPFLTGFILLPEGFRGWKPGTVKVINDLLDKFVEEVAERLAELARAGKLSKESIKEVMEQVAAKEAPKFQYVLDKNTFLIHIATCPLLPPLTVKKKQRQKGKGGEQKKEVETEVTMPDGCMKVTVEELDSLLTMQYKECPICIGALKKKEKGDKKWADRGTLARIEASAADETARTNFEAWLGSLTPDQMVQVGRFIAAAKSQDEVAAFMRRDGAARLNALKVAGFDPETLGEKTLRGIQSLSTAAAFIATGTKVYGGKATKWLKDQTPGIRRAVNKAADELAAGLDGHAKKVRQGSKKRVAQRKKRTRMARVLRDLNPFKL